MAAVLKGYLSTQSLPVGTEKKMAGLQLVSPTGYSRVEELSELSGLIVEEDGESEGEKDKDTDVEEYDVVQREEAADMPPQFPRCASASYGAISPCSPRRKRKRTRRRVSSYSQNVPPHFSLSPQHLPREHDSHHHRQYFSTTALAQVHGWLQESLWSMVLPA